MFGKKIIQLTAELSSVVYMTQDRVFFSNNHNTQPILMVSSLNERNWNILEDDIVKKISPR